MQRLALVVSAAVGFVLCVACGTDAQVRGGVDTLPTAARASAFSCADMRTPVAGKGHAAVPLWSKKRAPQRFESEGVSPSRPWVQLDDILTEVWTPTLPLSGNAGHLDSMFPGAHTHVLNASNFGFSLPDGAQIRGITATLLWWDSAFTPGELLFDHVSLSLDGVRIGEDRGFHAEVWHPITVFPGPQAFGDADDHWGASLTQDIINDARFGWQIEIFQPKGYPSHSHSLDLLGMELEVAYCL